MPIIKAVKGIAPKFGKNIFLAENCTVLGEVITGDDCSIWFNAVVRGDVNYIHMGNKVNVQDGAIIHCTYQKAPTKIGNNVSIGRILLLQIRSHHYKQGLLPCFFLQEKCW